MATNVNSTANIQDGWEEISSTVDRASLYDDTASVQSLPTTVSDSEDFSLCEGSLSDDEGQPGTADDPPGYTEHSALNEHGRENSGPFSLAADTKQRQDKVEDDAASVHSDVTITEDLLDIDVDPTVLQSSIKSLMSTLDETVPAYSKLHGVTEGSALNTIGTELQVLKNLLADLEEVVSFYANTWNADKSKMDTPLDPALYKWTSDCMIVLLGLQAEIQNELSVVAHSLTDSKWDDFHAALVDFNEQMSSFLPIIKIDLDEFQTAQLDFPPAYSDQPSSPGGRVSMGFDPDAAIDGPIPNLRRHLYALKDDIQSLAEPIKGLLAHNSSSTSILSTLYSEQVKVCQTLSFLLSNHGSDWIEQGLAGGLTYPEFCSLNVNKISDLRAKCRTFRNFLSRARPNTLPSRDEDGNLPATNEETDLEASELQRMRDVVLELMAMLKMEAKQSVEASSGVEEVRRDQDAESSSAQSAQNLLILDW